VAASPNCLAITWEIHNKAIVSKTLETGDKGLLGMGSLGSDICAPPAFYAL